MLICNYTSEQIKAMIVLREHFCNAIGNVEKQWQPDCTPYCQSQKVQLNEITGVKHCANKKIDNQHFYLPIRPGTSFPWKRIQTVTLKQFRC